MQVYLAQDPNSARILAQDRPIDRATDLPRGDMGDGWEKRHLTVDNDVWIALLTGQVSPTNQDVLHQAWWDTANPG